MPLTFAEWLSMGLKLGWVSEPACVIHNGLPCTEEESEDIDDGYDICQYGLRLWWPADKD